MKLLDKTTIVTLKGNERRNEIEEGLKLAKKIDLLRETSAKEEQSLAKFRTESLKKTKEDIDALVSEKRALEGDIEGLNAQRTALLIPLTDQWNAVNEKEALLHNLNESLSQKEQQLNKVEAGLKEERLKLETDKQKIQDIKERETKTLSEIENLKQEVNKLLIETDQKSNIIITSLDKREKALSNREKEVEYDAKDNENYKKSLVEMEKNLDIREKAIKDKYETLQRTIQRLK